MADIAAGAPVVNNPQLNNIRDTIASTVQGNKNVPTLYGHIDVMTNDRIYVIKSIDEWCAGIGLLEVFRQSFPNKIKCLHLYNIGIQPNTLNKIITITTSMGIQLTVEQ
tara:strand:- start:117 stop:443 length:327 start_codon:yes stop_codon:yes gene_type:complete